MKAVSLWCLSLFHATGSLQLDLVDMHLETSEKSINLSTKKTVSESLSNVSFSTIAG